MEGRPLVAGARAPLAVIRRSLPDGPFLKIGSGAIPLWHAVAKAARAMMTLALLILGLALFALCFRSVDWFETI